MLQTFITVTVGFVIYFYVKQQLDYIEWRTDAKRKLVAFMAMMLCSVIFGSLCGYTGFLR
jgi:hypothetical protein